MLVDLTPADIAECMRIERLPGYDAFVGQWTAEEHANEMASPAARYLGWRTDEGLAGFVIFQRYLDPVVRLRRIAVTQPDGGTGARLLLAVIDWLFERNPASAIDLHVRPANERAIKVYSREGFVMAQPEDDDAETMILTRERRAQRKALTS